MVAYTTDFCLPYFEGTDSPCVDTGAVCAPSTVWCDMAAKIDEAFTGFDDTISRAVESFPYAQVAVSEVPFELTTGDSTSVDHLVLWDTAIGDSDSMVDLDVDPSSITIRRSGLWNFNCIVVWRSSTDDDELRVQLITPGAPKLAPTFANIRERWIEAIPFFAAPLEGPTLGLSNVLDMFYPVDVSTGPAPVQIQLSASTGTNDSIITVEVCRFSARWVADLP